MRTAERNPIFKCELQSETPFSDVPLEGPNLLKSRSLESSCPFFLCDNSELKCPKCYDRKPKTAFRTFKCCNRQGKKQRKNSKCYWRQGKAGLDYLFKEVRVFITRATQRGGLCLSRACTTRKRRVLRWCMLAARGLTPSEHKRDEEAISKWISKAYT